MAEDSARMRVLLAEDEATVAALLEDQLKELGCIIVGPAGHLAHVATVLAHAAIDAAIVDLNLHGEMAFGLVRQLSERGIPVLVVSAYDQGHVRKELPGVPFLEKPFGSEEFVAAVERLLSKAAEQARALAERTRKLSSE